MTNDLKPVGIDLPVLLIFFTRPDTFKEVFRKVKEARPSKLFLACDGARADHPEDAQRIEECKKIAEDIDWECEVYKNYSESNMGCGMRPQSAITWAFETVDRLVILEDDCVPHDSFFPYMAELLERYKNDERICMVSGLNHMKEWDCGGYSYCFTKTGAIWGWGTWKRVWDKYDYFVSGIQSEYIQRLLMEQITYKRARKPMIARFLKTAQRLQQGEKISYWDFQFGYLKRTQSYLSIVPRVNLIQNIGVGNYSSHAQFDCDGIWKKGMLHFMPTESIDIPLKHPNFVMADVKYDNAVDAKYAYPHPLKRFYGRVKRVLRRILFRK